MKTDTLAQRLNYAMTTLGVSQKELADAVEVSQAAIQKITSGKTKRSKFVNEIARVLGIRIDWLLKGEGEMMLPPQHQLGPNLHELNISSWDNDSPLLTAEVEIPLFMNIEQIYDSSDVVNNSDTSDFIRLQKSFLIKSGANPDGSGVIAFILCDPVMKQIIPSGSIIAVNRNDTKIQDGKTYLINQGGLIRVRSIYRRPGSKILIKGTDPADDEMHSESDAEILGRVFWYSAAL